MKIKMNTTGCKFSCEGDLNIELDLSPDEIKSMATSDLGAAMIRRMSSEAVGGLASKFFSSKKDKPAEAKSDAKVLASESDIYNKMDKDDKAKSDKYSSIIEALSSMELGGLLDVQGELEQLIHQQKNTIQA